MSSHFDPSSPTPRPTVQIPLPDVHIAPQSYGQHVQTPYEPNARTIPEYRPSQPFSRPNVHMPLSRPDHRFQSSPAHVAYPPGATQPQPSNALENQLRNMILSNDPPPSHQAFSQPVGLPAAQYSAPSPPGGSRRPNQAQRKQQAQHMQVPLQHASMAASTMSGHSYPHRAFSSQNQSLWANQVSRQPPQYNNVPPPRQLYDPHAGTGRGNTRRGGYNIPQGARNQDQLEYINQLATAKIPEIQIGPEEYAEKQMLRERLEHVCRLAILDLDAQSEGVELKPFGSLSIGFATRESDMDLVLVSPKSKPDLSSSKSEVPRLIERTLMDMGYGARLLTQTRVPIIKFCEKPGPELAAHLRLTRLQWETECDAHSRRASSESAKQAEATPPEESDNMLSQISTDDTQESETSTLPLTPSTPITANLESGVTLHPDAISPVESPKSPISPSASTPAIGSTKAKKAQTPSGARKIQHDPSWLWRMSDYELIGLYKTALKEGHHEPHQKSIIAACLDSLEARDDTRDLSMISRSKALETLQNLPNVIKKCRVPGREDLDFPNSGVGTQCDVNFSNQLALHNSLLLKCYSLCDPRVRQMVLFVKAWTKRRKINSPYHGTLNSYGYVLMALHYLMNVARPPVVPNLQLATEMIQNDPLSASEVSFDGHNIQFFRNEAVIEQMARDGMITQNTESLGSLLRGFFHFYANPPYGTFSWKDDVLSIRTKGGILKKVGKGWVGARTEMVDLAGPGAPQKKVNHHYVVAIEDPFEIGHNVARTVFFNGVVAIRDEFRRAAELITNAGMDPRQGPQDFFAEGKKNENLQHRGFPQRRDAGQKKEKVSGNEGAPGTKEAPAKDTEMGGNAAGGRDVTREAPAVSEKDRANVKDIASEKPTKSVKGTSGGKPATSMKDTGSVKPTAVQKGAATQNASGLSKNTSRKETTGERVTRSGQGYSPRKDLEPGNVIAPAAGKRQKTPSTPKNIATSTVAPAP